MKVWTLGAVAAVACLLPLACTLKNTETSSGPAAAGDGGALDGGGGADAQAGYDCPAVVQCAVNCASGDTACQNDCVARGTDDGRSKAIAFVTCVGKNSCQDAACIKSSCINELDACVAMTPPSGGTPIPGAAPPGSVPADFVGTWKRTTYTISDAFTFNADGTAIRKTLEVSGFSGCSNSVAFEYAGTVVFTPAKDGFTFYITSATNTSSACGQSSSGPGATGAFDFTIEPIPALGPGKNWFFNVQGCPVTAEVDKRIQCGGEYDL